MNGITTHVLDVSTGRPAVGVLVTLYQRINDVWEKRGDQVTDSDGRARELLGGELTKGEYRLTFDVESYFRRDDVESFYREITIDFVVTDSSQHYHVPLLLSPFGYSTYRGS